MNLFSKSIQSHQGPVTEFLTHTLLSNKLVNAYCFLGDAQKDKLQVATELTKILNCKENSSSEKYKPACNNCINCKWIESSTHPMTPIFVQPKQDSKKQIISVEAIKELQQELVKSSEYYRVIIIPQANYMTLGKHSANALLKILEEPNSKTLFVLFAEDAELVLPTIISRSQQMQFKSNPSKEYSEEALELYKEFYMQIYADSKLSAMSLAEDLGSRDSKSLVEFLEILQDKLSEALSTEASSGLSLASQIEMIEEAKVNLKNFVRPKTAIEQMLLRGFLQGC